MPAMPENENRSFIQELEALGSDIEQGAEEVRLQVHLASMDAKDAWSDLQPRIEEFDRRVVNVAREVADEAKSAGAELRDVGRGLRDELKKLRDALK